MGNRYYWLKLQRNFFDGAEIKALRTMENGTVYIIIWLKLLLMSAGFEGQVRFNNRLPYTDKLLAAVLGENIDHIRGAIKIFEEMGMLEITNDGTIWIESAVGMVGSITESAQRMRRFRERKTLLALPAPEEASTEGIAASQSDEEIEIEKEKEEETEKLSPSAPATSSSQPLLPEEKKCVPALERVASLEVERGVFLAEGELAMLEAEFGKEAVRQKITSLSTYRKRDSYLLTLRKWLMTDRDKCSKATNLGWTCPHCDKRNSHTGVTCLACGRNRMEAAHVN
jgi:predicted phage replisome organizer